MISFTLGTRWQKQENNIIVDDKEYVGMPGLWELIVEQLLMITFSPMGILIIMLK